MGEIAMNKAAFQAEFSKAMTLLPSIQPGAPPLSHEEGLRRVRGVRNMQQVIVHYAARLPSDVGVPILLENGDVLMARAEYRLCLDTIYTYLEGLKMLSDEFEPLSMTPTDRVSYQVQSVYGICVCGSSFLLRDDPQVQHPDTRRDILDILRRLKEAVAMALPEKSLYWLSFNGTLHIFRLATLLSTLGFSDEALEHLVFAALAMETHVEYGLPKYLRWRVQLTAAVVNTYLDLGALKRATAFVDRVLAKVQAAEKLFSLDPVPMTVEQVSSFQSCFSRLHALRFKCSGETMDGGVDGIREHLEETLPQPDDRVLAVAEALQSSKRRTADHKPPSDGQKELLGVVSRLLGPQLPVIKAVVEGRRALRLRREAAGEEAEARGITLEELLEERRAEDEAKAEERAAAEEARRLEEEKAGKGKKGKKPPPKGKKGAAEPEPEPEPEEDPNDYVETPERVAAFSEATCVVPIDSARKLIEVSFNYEEWGLFEKLLTSNRLRVSQDGDQPGRLDVLAVTEVLAALRTLETDPGDASFRGLVTAIQKWYDYISELTPDLLTDLGMMLWKKARDIIEGAENLGDQDTELAEVIATCVHEVFEGVGLDDTTLRLVVALRLANLLELRGACYDAVRVLRDANAAATKGRHALLTKTRGAKDETVRWISASASQPTREAEAYTKQMEENEQVLACLHADVTLRLFRAELACGLEEQAAVTTRRVTKATKEIEKADGNASIFGAKTAATVRKDAARLTRAGTQATHPVQKERELLQGADKNPYERALLLIAAAPLHEERRDQERMLQEAAAALQAAQKFEDALFTMATKKDKERKTGPAYPKVYCRTPTTVTLTAPRIYLTSNRKPAHYKAYGKSFGVGVTMSINSTAMEYEGLGKPLAIGERVTIEGLKPNDTYIFAVAAYDSKDRLIGELGKSTPEVPVLLPMPLYLCWSYLTTVSSRLGCAPVAQLGASIVMDHFLVRTPKRPLWEAHPGDAETLHREHADKAAWPLLRAAVHVMFLWVSKLAAPAAEAPPKDQRTPYLEDQITRLRAARRLGIALQIASILGDTGLIMEGAIRMNNLVVPLLALTDKTPMLIKTLSNCHIVVQGVAKEISLRQVSTKQMQYTAARATSAMAFQLVTLASKHVEPFEESPAAAYFAKLECDLLKALDVSLIADSPDGMTPVPELVELQDVLLHHPKLESFVTEGGALAKRRADSEDVRAVMLPLLNSQPAEATWTKLQEFKEKLEYAEIGARLLEQAVSSGESLDNVKQWGKAILADVKEQGKVPYDEVIFRKWDLLKMAALVEIPAGSVTLDEEEEKILKERIYGGEEPPEGLSPEEAQQLEERIADSKERRLEELTFQEQNRIAAAELLQARVLPLLRYRKKLKAARQLLNGTHLWRSRIHMLLGTLAAAKARTDKEEQRERDAIKETNAASGSEEATPAASPPKTPPTAKRPASPPKKGASKKNAAAAAEPQEPAEPTEIMALRHLTMAAELAARQGHWHQLQNVARLLCNLGRPLVNENPDLASKAPKIVWKQEEIEVQLEPPPEAKPKTAKGTAKGGKTPKSPPKKSPAKKGTAAAGAAQDLVATKMIWVAEGGGICMSRLLRVAAERCIELIGNVRSGDFIHARLVPEQALVDRDEDKGIILELPDRRPPPARPAASESNFSLGSDAVPMQWFNEQDDIDIYFYNRIVKMALNVFKLSNRWHSMFDVAGRFNHVSDEHFAESLIPFQMLAAPFIGTDIAKLQVALEQIVRDKKQALEELHRVRNYVRDRLATVSLLQTAPDRKAKKKAGSKFKGNAGRLKALEQVSASSRAGGGKYEHGSAVTGLTSRTSKTKATSRPENVVVPEQYEKVIELLKERQEKVWQVQAMNELADVHAHFGSWPEAVQLWNDALDTVIGPYQVIKAWRPCFSEYSTSSEMLNHYGLQWVLLAGGVLLGKLVRYGYPYQIGTQLEAARMAAELLYSIFSASSIHPQRRMGFAAYTPVELWDRVNPLEDPYAAPLEDLLAGCDSIASCLLENGLALDALPVLSLYDHLASRCARDVGETVHCRQLRVQACAQLGLLAEGHRTLVSLMAGLNLPDLNSENALVVRDPEHQPVKVAVPTQPFDSRLPASHPDNAAAVEFVSSTELPEPLKELYGKYQTCRIMMRRSEWLMAIGAHPNLWKVTSPKAGKELPEAERLEPVEQNCLQQAGTILDSVMELTKADFYAARRARLSGSSEAPKGDKKGGKKDAKDAKPAKGGKGGDRPASSDMPKTDAPEGDYKMLPEDHEAMVQALLMMSEVNRLQWKEKTAIKLLQTAMAHISKVALEVRNNAGSNSATERTLFGARLWMRCRKMVCRIYLDLGHTGLLHQMEANAHREASELKEAWMMLSIRGYGVAADVLEGSTSAALTGYKGLLTTYEKLGLGSNTLEGAKVLLEHASLLDRLGFRKTSSDVDRSALAVLRFWTHEMGLHEAKEHPELVNVYASGTSMLVEAILRVSRHEMRQMHFEAARNLAQEAVDTLPYGRALPLLHAKAAAALARCQRHMLLPPPVNPIKLTVPEMASARSGLQQCLAWAVHDGGHDHDVIRFAMLEAAALLLANKELNSANDIMQLAYFMSKKIQTLRHATHTIDGVSAGSLPKWLADIMASREGFLVSDRTSALPSSRALPDPEVGRLALCELLNLRRRTSHGSWDLSQRASAQAADLHNALKAACPKYAAECLQPTVPLIPGAPENAEAAAAAAASAAPAKEEKGGKGKGKGKDAGGGGGASAAAMAPIGPGTVVVVWHEQDGCWQHNDSWYGEGELGPEPTDSEILTQEPPPASVAMLHIVVPSTVESPCEEDALVTDGLADFGDKAYPLLEVKAMQRIVKDLRIRAEEGPQEGQPLMSSRTPPEAEEMRQLLREFGTFLRQDAIDDEPTFSDDPVRGSQAVAVRQPLMSGDGLGSVQGDKAESEDAPPAGALEGEPEYLNAGVEILPKLEALLNIDDGMYTIDPGFADWLRSVFHPN